MADKKREDFEIEEPEFGERESDNLVGRSGSQDNSSASNSNTSFSLAKVANNGPVSIVAYCVSSISMTVVNKYVVSGDFWNLNFLYLALQAIVCITAITACKKFGLITNLGPVEAEKAKKWFPISFLLVGMIYTSIKALQFLSVPVYTIFKNLTIIAIAYGEVLWFGGSVTRLALVSFVLMVLSSVVAAWADIQHALSGDSESSSKEISTLNAGYFWMALNVVCTASYILGMRKVIKKMNFKDWDTMYYNNLLTIPILVVCSLITENWSSANLAKNFPIESRNAILTGIVYSGVAAIFISYCSAWCIRVTSSTTYSMVGALNKLPLAISGLVFFSAPITFGSVSAIFLGFISGMVYTWSKIKESDAAKNILPTSSK